MHAVVQSAGQTPRERRGKGAQKASCPNTQTRYAVLRHHQDRTLEDLGSVRVGWALVVSSSTCFSEDLLWQGSIPVVHTWLACFTFKRNMPYIQKRHVVRSRKAPTTSLNIIAAHGSDACFGHSTHNDMSELFGH